MGFSHCLLQQLAFSKSRHLAGMKIPPELWSIASSYIRAAKPLHCWGYPYPYWRLASSSNAFLYKCNVDFGRYANDDGHQLLCNPSSFARDCISSLGHDDGGLDDAKCYQTCHTWSTVSYLELPLSLVSSFVIYPHALSTSAHCWSWWDKVTWELYQWGVISSHLSSHWQFSV